MLPTLFLSFFIGLVTAYFAQMRFRSPFFWFCIGMLFGMLGLLFLFFLPPLERELAIDEEEKLSDQWFYLDKQHNIREAPELGELKMFWAKGIVNENSYFWKKGMGDWKEAKYIPIFQKLFNLNVAAQTLIGTDSTSKEL